MFAGKTLSIGASVLALAACGSDGTAPSVAVTTPVAVAPTPTPTPTPAPVDTIPWDGGTLVFQTGFGGSTKVEPLANGNHKITGRDEAITLSDWTTDIATFGNPSRAGIEYTGGDAAKRLASIGSDPLNPANATLRFVLREAWLASENETKARVQLDMYGLAPGLREYRQSVRVFLNPDFRRLESFPNKIDWLTLAEFWNNEWWEPTERYGFRITVGIGKPDAATQALNLFVEAEDKGQVRIWRADDRSATVPIGQWFTLDTYFREGNATTGRFAMALTPDGGARRVIYDVRNFTHNTTDPAPNGLTGYNPLKLYTSKPVVDHVRSGGGALQIDWDNLKIWRVR